jgi:FlaA1/EpsC-like NDP-sugar epimerase
MSEAAQLVIQAGAMSNNNDVFVLDMGQPVKIIDLARKMIELSGLTVRDRQTPKGDIEIDVTGLRPGEKLYEELLIGNNPQITPHASIMKAHEEFLPWIRLEKILDKLQLAVRENDVESLRSLIKQLVPDYFHNAASVDLVHLERKG